MTRALPPNPHYLTNEDILRNNQIWEEKNPPSQDFLIMEFLHNGDLRNLILKTREANTFMPDDVLWRFFMCLVKQCTALQYPVRKFHPERRAESGGDLEEQIPPEYQRWRGKRFVHFDFDPLNSKK